MKKIKNQVQKYKMLSEHTLEDYLKWYKNDFSNQPQSCQSYVSRSFLLT